MPRLHKSTKHLLALKNSSETVFMRISLLILLQVLLLTSNVQAQEKSIHKDIAAVLKGIKDFNDKEWKRDSTNNRILRSHTEEDVLRQYNFYKKVDGQLKAIDKKSLSFDDQ